jgi:pimeloyl-ACP methyl ester carboxylesterase
MPQDPKFPARRRYLVLPGRGEGEVSLLDFGPPDRPVDAVFLHANGFNAGTYSTILGPLAVEYRLLAVDQRGHGLTSLDAEPSGRADWLDLRDDLLALMKVEDLADVVLSGHSMGGTVSLLAAAISASAKALVLFDPVILPEPILGGAAESPMVQAALRRRDRFASRDEAFAAYRGRGAFRTWPEETLYDYLETGLAEARDGGFTLACAPAWEAANYAAQGHDSRAALSACSAPIRILTAEMGSTFRLTAASDLEALAPKVHLETVAGTTHFLPMERPDLVRAALAAAIVTKL